ncbi:hypothetical protein [Marimonas arenosa]|uniref:Uncharacterized protein n=1 Tax=Marimonas arenosa TaxID=1795305 RepID=A0AAE3WAT6_9RHOB|nr:hypothetical protein [Marimonas arenosa]MDQ2089304.1 hypothetical protein [Marimonas arenosa]
MRDLAFILVSLALPAATIWALRAVLPARLRALAFVPLAMLLANSILVWATLACAGGGETWQSCTPTGLTPVFNGLRPLLLHNLTLIFLLCPGALILAGIAAIIRKEGHGS